MHRSAKIPCYVSVPSKTQHTNITKYNSPEVPKTFLEIPSQPQNPISGFIQLVSGPGLGRPLRNNDTHHTTAADLISFSSCSQTLDESVELLGIIICTDYWPLAPIPRKYATIYTTHTSLL